MLQVDGGAMTKLILSAFYNKWLSMEFETSVDISKANKIKLSVSPITITIGFFNDGDFIGWVNTPNTAHITAKSVYKLQIMPDENFYDFAEVVQY